MRYASRRPEVKCARLLRYVPAWLLGPAAQRHAQRRPDPRSVGYTGQPAIQRCASMLELRLQAFWNAWKVPR